ncbi:hypothetical protein ACG04R_23280 [Roseateles sp. BYS78W]|uniref:MarR family transcriptional regulator n=1 Tax=Pelomonas candidula TaxID=3299025 RepID=A0ABW7HIX1_9BURK
MSSHPMIQPASWDEPPSVLAGGMSRDRLALYKVIWNSALACTVKAPTLRHQRAVYRTPGGAVAAFASAEVVGTSLGYWRFRQDWPRMPFAEMRTSALPKGELTISLAAAVPLPGSSLGGLLRQMAARGVTTAASCASTLKEMLAPESPAGEPLLRIRTRREGRTAHIELTQHGRRCLRTWEASGLVHSNQRTNQLIEEVATQETSYRAALEEIGGGLLGPSAGDYVDAIRARWAGLSRNQLTLEKVAASTRAPKHAGLPSWLDPENSLPQNHPLRELKLSMELELAQSLPEWSAMTPKDQAAARLEWLARYCEQDGELAYSLRPHMEGLGAAFSGLRFWLTGALM